MIMSCHSSMRVVVEDIQNFFPKFLFFLLFLFFFTVSLFFLFLTENLNKVEEDGERR